MMNFGIIGAGNIAVTFVKAAAVTPQANVLAVASKSLDRAEQFATTHNIPLFYGTYAELLQNPDIETVYIATTNNFHFDNICQCLNAGKHVLCEKPMTLTVEETQIVCNLAQEKHLFLMEGMWSRFLPRNLQVKDWIRSNKIGTVKLMQANIGWVADPIWNKRLYDKTLGGGSLYDLAVYPIDLLPWYVDKEILSYQFQKYDTTEVTDLLNLNLQLEGCLINLQSSFTTKLPEDAWIYGDKGYIHIPKIHYGAKAFLYDLEDNITETYDIPEPNGFRFEIQEVMDCIASGKLESPVCPWSMTELVASIYETITNEKR